VNGPDRGSVAWGVVFCVLGVAFLLDALDVWEVRMGVLVPLLLIVAGIVLAISAAWPRSTPPPGGDR
jgi:hypothetical protein